MVYAVLFRNHINNADSFFNTEKARGGVKQKRILCVVLSLAWLSVSYGHDFLGLDQTFLFFSALFVLGNVCLEVQLNTRAYILFSVLCVLGWWISGYEQKDILLVDLLNSKFPPRLVYGFACMLGILLSMYYRGKYNKFINHIGKRSTYYFFAQGVSCSIMYHLVPRYNYFSKWIICYLVAFCISVLISVIIAELLALVYENVVSRVIKSLWDNGRKWLFKT